jgi:predicted nucleic acid-binding protein
VSRPRVLDASVLVADLFDEPASNEARAALAEPDPLHAPDYALTECANAVWKRFIRGEMEPGEATALLLDAERIPVELHRTADLLPAALVTAMRTRHPVYDCIYIALAEMEDAELVTADTCQAEAAREAGVAVRVIGPG